MPSNIGCNLFSVKSGYFDLSYLLFVSSKASNMAPLNHLYCKVSKFTNSIYKIIFSYFALIC